MHKTLFMSWGQCKVVVWIIQWWTAIELTTHSSSQVNAGILPYTAIHHIKILYIYLRTKFKFESYKENPGLE